MISWRRLAVLSAVLACVLLASSAQRTAINVGSKAKDIRDGAPRFSGSACPYASSGASAERKEECDTAKYGINLGVIAGFCFVMALLSWFFLLCRCVCGLCCKCCKTQGSEKATENRKMWLITSIVIAAIMFIIAATAIGYSQSFTDSAVSGKTSSFGVFIELLRSLRAFSLKIKNLGDGIIDSLNDAVDTTADSLQAGRLSVNSAQDASDCMNGAAGTLRAVGCGAPCSELADSMVGGAANMKNGTDAFFTELQTSLAAVQENLVDAQDATNEELGVFTRTMGDVDSTFGGAESSLADVQDQAESIDRQRHLVLIFLVLPFMFSFVFVVLGAVTKKSFVFRCNYWLVLVFSGFLWVVAAVHAPVTVVMADGCGILDKGEVALTDQFAVEEKTTAIVYSCIDNTTLKGAIPELDTLNLKDRIESSWPNQNASNIGDSFTAIDTVDDQVTNLDCTPGDCTAFKDEWAGCMAKVSLLRGNMTVVANSVSEVRRDIQPALNLIDSFIKEASCGFIGEAYRNLKTGLCEDLPGDMGGIALMTVLLGSLGFIYIYVALKTRAAYMDYDDGLSSL